MRCIIVMLLVGFVVGFADGGAQAAEKSTENMFAAGTVWVNELGSEMTIKRFGPNGSFQGTYVTAAGCGVGRPRPLVGWSNRGAVTFTVNFQECASATSWTGNITSDGKLFTLWQLALSGVSKWNSIAAGSDTFTRR